MHTRGDFTPLKSQLPLQKFGGIVCSIGLSGAVIAAVQEMQIFASLNFGPAQTLKNGVHLNVFDWEPRSNESAQKNGKGHIQVPLQVDIDVYMDKHMNTSVDK